MLDFVKYKKNEKGFTLLEGIVGLFIISFVFIVIFNVYVLGVGKTNYLHDEKKIVGFEQDLISWIKKDFRENSIVSIEVRNDRSGFYGDNTVDEKCTSDIEDEVVTLSSGVGCNNIVFNLSDGGIIEYKNKVRFLKGNTSDKGYSFYRTTEDESRLLTENRVTEVLLLKNPKALKVSYNLGNFSKSVVIALDK